MGKYTARVTDHLVVPARVSLTPGQEDLDLSAGRTVPNPVSVQLLIDTGSKRSSLIPGIIEYLKPLPYRDVRVETSTGSTHTSLYWDQLEFPGTNLSARPEIAMARVAVPSSLANYHGVIGRDLLFAWEYLFLEGRRQRFTIRDVPSKWFGWLHR